MKNLLHLFFFLSLLAALFGAVVPVSAQSTLKFPLRANYYLGEINESDEFLKDIARYDLLILTPAQIQTHPRAIEKIRELHPEIVILAYVPSQSYNQRYWGTDPVFKKFKNLTPAMWLLDAEGNPIVDSFDVKWANLGPEWNNALLNFVQANIVPLNIDGIFFDMVSHNISWLQSGNIDINRDRKKDDANFADRIWLTRTKELLKQSSETLKTKYIVINGSSDKELQKYINGRMFETFPTPWEGDGQWDTVMNSASSIAKGTRHPTMLIFNGNSKNTGIQNNYTDFRFGFVSALLQDAYFSYDFGDRSHSQLWWYDEYGSDLGAPLQAPTQPTLHTSAVSEKYTPGVWMRSFQNGLALINSTDETQNVDLGGEYEKFQGHQDPQVNNGAIVTETEIKQNDGLILLRTFSTLQNALFTNGDFVRFFRPDGARLRNGFFVFEEKYKGGDQIAHVDLDDNGKQDLIVINKNKLTIWRDDNQLFTRFYPYGASYEGEIHLAFGDIDGDRGMEIVIAPGPGFALPLQVYTRDGSKMYDNWYPFGKQYTGGYSVGVLSSNEEEKAKIVIGSGTGRNTVVQLYNTNDFALFKEWFAYEKYFKGGVNVAVGDLDGDGSQEIVAGAGLGKKPTIKVFDVQGGLKYKEFTAYSALGNPGIDVRVMDVNFDGKDDIVGMSDGLQ